MVVGYKSQVDLLLFLLVAFDVTYGCKDSVGIFFRGLGFGFRPTSAFASATALVVTQGLLLFTFAIATPSVVFSCLFAFVLRSGNQVLANGLPFSR